MSQSPAGYTHRTPDSFPVVAIGGSAGSLRALQAFFECLPDEPGMAFIIVTHHPSDKKTLLPSILEQKTRLQVSEPEEGTWIERDHIYVALADGDWVLSGGSLIRRAKQTTGKTKDHQGGFPLPHHPVDALFRSLATERREGAIGIVLSGTGTDGTVGAKAIKAQAGMVMVQDPASAEFSGMPTSALDIGLVDYILPPEEMAPALVSYVQEEVQPEARATEPSREIPEDALEEILGLVREHTGHDLSGYKRSTLIRRLERRMTIHGIDTPAQYLEHLRRDPAETNLLFREALISVTNFFRDPKAWEALAQGPLKEQLHQAASARHDFRAWVVGCATGEEAYSLAILVSECLKELEETPTVQIFATDVDTEAIETARQGRYPRGIADDLTPERLAKHFIVDENIYRIRKPVREMVAFAEHNVLRDPPFTRMDLITCRNLLIYLERDLQKKLLPLFHYTLRPGGLLFLGNSESVGELSQAFSEVDKHWRIYRTEAGARDAGLPELPLGGARTGSSMSHPSAEVRGDALTRGVERLLASAFAPPSVLVNDDGDALYFHGQTGRFLEPAAGPAHNRLANMAKNGLRTPLVTALREVAGPEAETVQQRARVRTNGGDEEVLLEVCPVRVPHSLRGLRLVSFRPVPTAEPETEEGKPLEQVETEGESRMVELERELEATRQDKQVTIEELQSANEELQSMNEELQSMNEELQSSNEELEVSKEEVDSLNEELRSVNAELESRVSELSRANDDMKNLLDNTQIAIVFLDEEMRIARFTQAARDLISLRESDVGRPIDELSTSLRYEGLTNDAREVLDTLTPKEIEVQTEGGHWYLVRILPYRTTENVLSGLVCVFQDIQLSKQIETLEPSESLFRGIVQTVREPLLVLDPQLRVVSANEGFYRRFPLTPEEVEGKEIFEVGGGRWDHPELRVLLHEVLPSQEQIEGFELDLDFGEQGPSHVSLNARQLKREGDRPQLILLTLETERGEPH